MDHIKSVPERAHNYIHAIGRQFWATAFAHGHRYDMLTSNAAECTNSLLKKQSSAPHDKVSGRDTCKPDWILSETVNSSTKHHFTTNSVRKKVPTTEMEESQRLMVRCRDPGPGSGFASVDGVINYP